MDIKDNFCLGRHLLPAIVLYSAQQNWKCLHSRNRQYTEFYIPNFLRKVRFFSRLGFDVQTNSDHKTQKINSTRSEL